MQIGKTEKESLIVEKVLRNVDTVESLGKNIAKNSLPMIINLKLLKF